MKTLFALGPDTTLSASPEDDTPFQFFRDDHALSRQLMALRTEGKINIGSSSLGAEFNKTYMLYRLDAEPAILDDPKEIVTSMLDERYLNTWLIFFLLDLSSNEEVIDLLAKMYGNREEAESFIQSLPDKGGSKMVYSNEIQTELYDKLTGEQLMEVLEKRGLLDITLSKVRDQLAGDMGTPEYLSKMIPLKYDGVIFPESFDASEDRPFTPPGLIRRGYVRSHGRPINANVAFVFTSPAEATPSLP